MDSKTGTSLPGVSVIIKGTNKGVSTGLNGEFTISAKQGDVLIVSFFDKNYLVPIPSYEIQKNPKLVQNPGYN
ncbi:MAG: carboxypeptidase-like regulatory domain-containing protein [Bacteroidetes bacterium]|nr:carboxypeptidase-like regulatory domain-containing protein [Bacteroidota bacterium]